MPGCLTLIRRARADEQVFLHRTRDELKCDRRSGAGEAARHGDCRIPSHVEWRGEAHERQKRARILTQRFHLLHGR